MATVQEKLFRNYSRESTDLSRVNLAWHDLNRFMPECLTLEFYLTSNLRKVPHTAAAGRPHTQLQTHHALRRSQPLPSCPPSHARPATLHKPPMQSLREVPTWHVWCGGPAWRMRDAPRLPHMFELPRPRDFRRGHCWWQKSEKRDSSGGKGYALTSSCAVC